ncbi:MAG: SLC13 family permease [Gammaproteobacteria bacterium]|nr:SLC13 family permease [Gammaproteobacteria bacterium]
MAVSVRSLGLILGPAVAILIGLIMFYSGFEAPGIITGSVTALVIVWWLFEPIPIPVTSLIPLTLFPMLGVLKIGDVSSSYGHPLILLLLGGFILSTAMEKSGAHRRIALTMLHRFGGDSPRRLILGFMATSAVLSMWISNTATTLMLLPVAIAIIDQAKDDRFTVPLLLGVAHAASVGGIGTPIGTPPNLVFRGIYEQTTGNTVGFFEWMMWGIPVVLLFIPLMALWLTRNLNYKTNIQIPEIGTWTPAEKRVMAVFVFTALAWIFRTGPFGGWQAWLGLPYSSDYMVAFTSVALFFLIPDGKGSRLLDWKTAERIPWGMLLLFGAGLSIAKAFMESGLSEVLADQLSAIGVLPTILIILIICTGVTFLTEATSNTATTTLLMPILAAVALGIAVDPRLFMVAAAMSASCAFMLPVATPPNVVVFSTDRFPVSRMVREGFVLNLIGVAIITLVCFLYFGL